MRRLLPALLALAACGEETMSAAERGAELAASPALSSSPFNEMACTTCHATGRGDGRILPGYPLGGAAARPSFWGGAFVDLKDAVDFCLVYFMKGQPLERADADARALYEYLVSIDRDGPREALPLTIVLQTLDEPERGDPGRGAEVHRQACASCHGQAPTGQGGGLHDAPGLPDEAAEEAQKLLDELGLPYPVSSVFVEKVRHGRFFGAGGTMPPFALEMLSDEDLGALLAFYGL